MPRTGLILDVRGNGGGDGFASEYLLQYLTPRRIQPKQAQLTATLVTADLCEKVDILSRWLPSIVQALRIGAQYSAALPLNQPARINDVGQIYHGPVVLITDALCYSATDTFVASFQDHQVGTVLGVDESTGAGGANVWTLASLLTLWPGAPVEPLPHGADLRVALRRTLRLGDRSGQPVEDIGVQPDVLYRLTKRDLLEGNVDLMDRAGELLAGQIPRTLDVEVTLLETSVAKLTVTTAQIATLDSYVNDRPVAGMQKVSDGVHTATVPLGNAARAHIVRLEGFDSEGKLVAARTVNIAQ